MTPSYISSTSASRKGSRLFRRLETLRHRLGWHLEALQIHSRCWKQLLLGCWTHSSARTSLLSRSMSFDSSIDGGNAGIENFVDTIRLGVAGGCTQACKDMRSERRLALVDLLQTLGDNWSLNDSTRHTCVRIRSHLRRRCGVGSGDMREEEVSTILCWHTAEGA